MLKIGKKPKRPTNDASHLVVPRRISRENGRVPDEGEPHRDRARGAVRARLTCENRDCGHNNTILVRDAEAIVRFRLGYVLYRQHGVSLRPIFKMTPGGEEELFAHVDCAVDAGLRPEEMEKSQCYHCGSQFFCEEDPEETALLIEIGGLDEDRNFVSAHRGAIHWACAHRNWAPELFEEIEGTPLLIKEVEDVA